MSQKPPSRAAADFGQLNLDARGFADGLHVAHRRRTSDLRLKRADIDIDDLFIFAAGIVDQHFLGSACANAALRELQRLGVRD